MVEEKKNQINQTQLPGETPTITAGDLNLMVNMIDAGSQRGAWRGEELSTIGNLRTKLRNIIKLVAPQLDEQSEEKTAEETKPADSN